MSTILQDMMGMLKKKGTVTPKPDNYMTLARFPNPQERLKPRPTLQTELVTLSSLKTFFNSGRSTEEYVNAGVFDGATDTLTLTRVGGTAIQIDMNRKDVKEFVNFTLISANTAAPVQLPVAAPGQLFIVASAGAGANATVNLPNASATGWVFRKITVTTNGTTSGSRTLTLNAAGSEEINGAGTLVLNKLYASVTLWSDGTNWIVLSSSQVADL